MSVAGEPSRSPSRSRRRRPGAVAAVRVVHAVAAVICVWLAVSEAGLWALPLFSLPLLAGQLSFRRYRAVRATRWQTVASLSRSTEVAGYTLPGHAARVADLASAIGRELGLGARDLELIEYAALMHDIGQLSLVDPVPGGATALLPVQEQRRIGRLGSEVIRQTGVPERVAEIVAAVAEPYRLEDGTRDPFLPQASTIVRVANAFDDLGCADGGIEQRREVLQRLRRNTASEYEPHAVEALARVCLRSPGRR